MKKKNFKSLSLNKKSISNLSPEFIKGGEDPTYELTCPNSIYICDGPATASCQPPKKCYTQDGGLSCGIICILGDPNYSILCSRDF